jgi:hypothetical protein
VDDFDASFQAALILGFEGDFKASMSAFDALIVEYPSNLDLRYELAMTQLMLGLIDEGCNNLKFILSVDPAHERALQQASGCE